MMKRLIAVAKSLTSEEVMLDNLPNLNEFDTAFSGEWYIYKFSFDCPVCGQEHHDEAVLNQDSDRFAVSYQCFNRSKKKGPQPHHVLVGRQDDAQAAGA